MAQRSLDLLGVGLRHGPAGPTLVKTTCGVSQVACADQSDVIFSAIPGYMEAARGFARLAPAALAPSKASQPDTAATSDTHPSAARSPCSGQVGTQSRRNRRRRRVRRCRKLSMGSVDSGIDTDLSLGLRASTDSTNGDMRIGKVTPMLTMGHRRPPAQVLAEPVTPGAQFVQHMAPVPMLASQPGDPPLGIQGQAPKRPLTAAQIKRRCRRHQRRAQQQHEVR